MKIKVIKSGWCLCYLGIWNVRPHQYKINNIRPPEKKFITLQSGLFYHGEDRPSFYSPNNYKMSDLPAVWLLTATNSGRNNFTFTFRIIL